MGQRQREWARKKRDWLFEQLGRKCKKCGSTTELEFDVIIPVGNDDHHRKKDWSARMSFYTKHFHHDNLQVLCTTCNSTKGNQLELHDFKSLDEPF